jgi:2-oxoglutaroyl-CoA hydrolase
MQHEHDFPTAPRKPRRLPRRDRCARERADVILDRPPFNIVSMPQRDQLRLVFEALDEDARVRVIVVRAAGEHFSSGGNIKGFMEATPENVSKLAWNIAAPARCAKPVIAANRGFCFGVGFELSLACDFRIASETCFYALPEQRLGQIPARAARRGCRRSSASRAPRTS